MERPLVSIVIPVYNGADYLAAAIDSALAQTYPAVEILVIDDGSDDDGATDAVVRGYGERIRCIRKANGGVATALNRGIDAMRGQLFSWLSHDDLYMPDKIERQVEAMRSFGGPCIVIGDFALMDAGGNALHTHSLAGWNLVARPLDAVFRGLINGCTLLVPRHLFRRVGTFRPDLPTTQDYELWYRMAREVPFLHCPGVGVRQRIHPGQGSRQHAHLDEAGRLYAELLDRTPAATMCAYEGSELAFLSRLRANMAVYPAALAYVDFRIAMRLRDVRITAVIPDGPDGPARAADLRTRLAGLSPHVDVHTLSRAERARDQIARLAELRGAGTWRGWPMPAGVTPPDPSDAVLWVAGDGTPCLDTLHQAMANVVGGSADMVLPPARPGGDWPLGGLLMRWSALPALAGAVDPDGAVDWGRLHLRTPAGAHGAPMPVDDGPAVGHDENHGDDDAVAAAVRAWAGRGPALLLLVDADSVRGRIHLDRLAARIDGRVRCVVARADGDKRLRISAGHTGKHPGLTLALPHEADALRALVAGVGVTRVDVLATVRLGVVAETVLATLALPFDVTQLVPPPSAAAPPFHLRRAQRVIAFSPDIADRVNGMAGAVRAEAHGHWGTAARHTFRPRVWTGETLRVLLLGDAGDGQDARAIAEVADAVAERGLPIRFHLFGGIASMTQRKDGAGNRVVIPEPGGTAPLIEAVAAVAPHAAWLPFRRADAWTAELCFAMDLGLPLVTTDLPVVARQCGGRPHTWLLPADSPAEAWLSRFLALHADGVAASDERPPPHSSGAAAPSPRPLSIDAYLAPTFAPAAAAGGRQGDAPRPAA
ncbi:glycosyltransferase [Azospirillum sp. ST 5-10]|uniref:glycosyltransferase n=1 Tax=unclassified Azospirillum TaxID=2630922 RepID=UPI003F4A4E96